MLSTATLRAALLYVFPSSLSVAVTPSASNSTLSLSFEKATAPRLAEWPLANLTNSSPIRKLNLAGSPSTVEATATMYPVVPGSRSEVRKLAVWFSVKQMKESAAWQFAPLIQNRWTATAVKLFVFVMLMRVFDMAGFVASEVYAL